MGRPQPRARPLIQQLIGLRALPLTESVSIKRNRLRWTGRLQPTPASREYLVALDYGGRSRPTVTVLSPELKIPDGESLPHTFGGERLCLHYPGQWSGTAQLATVIVPWASEWLLHYELWLATGEWQGGGHEPGTTGAEQTGT